jgi:hypothetical protein
MPHLVAMKHWNSSCHWLCGVPKCQRSSAQPVGAAAHRLSPLHRTQHRISVGINTHAAGDQTLPAGPHLAGLLITPDYNDYGSDVDGTDYANDDKNA